MRRLLGDSRRVERKNAARQQNRDQARHQRRGGEHDITPPRRLRRVERPEWEIPALPPTRGRRA